jgi:hypothetical protein
VKHQSTPHRNISAKSIVSPRRFWPATDPPGSPIEAIARDAAVTVSIALQFGADLETIRAALTRDHDGGPATALGAALDAIAGAAP